MSGATIRDNIGTTHSAVGDLLPDVPRRMWRLPVTATLHCTRLAA